MLNFDDAPELFLEADNDAELEDGLRELVKYVADRYGKRTEEELKAAVYLTKPMRQILRREKYHRENMFNVPIDFSALLQAR
jgi:hypothetical protein